ncbi:MAG: hypothetical protein PUP90_24025 [Nostoc sp. S4]|nr:hypothetical protein [Nostoc sp. S4]
MTRDKGLLTTVFIRMKYKVTDFGQGAGARNSLYAIDRSWIMTFIESAF